MTSKQRAFLRSIATNTETIFQIGKGGIPDSLVVQAEDAMKKRELIKLRVLETCEYTAKEAAEILAEKTKSEVVTVIGHRFVLFKQNKNPKERVIDIKL